MSTDVAVVPHALGLLAPPRQVGESTWSVDFDPDWRSFPSNMHGGVLVGTFALVAGAATDRWPAAVSVHLHSAVAPGLAQLEVQLNRTGRTASSAGVTLTQGDGQGDRRATGVVQLTADRPGAEVRTWPDAATAAALSGPAPEDLEPLQLPVELALMAQQLDIRPTGSSRPLADGSTPELSAWVRLRAGAAVGAVSHAHRLDLAAMLLDVLPPALYATRTSAVPIPTIELSAHFPPVTSSGDWFHVRQWTSWATEALCVDSSEVWDSSGRLVGEARQLRRIISV
jgi:acyl-CoA thioesterase